jgi:hypothetical protein
MLWGPEEQKELSHPWTNCLYKEGTLSLNALGFCIFIFYLFFLDRM